MTGKIQDDDIIIRINNLILKDRRGKLSIEESLELQKWINAHPSNKDWYEYIISDERTAMDFIRYQQAAGHKVTARIEFEQWMDQRRQDGAKVVRLRFLRRPFLDVAVAAVLLFTVAVGGWLYIHGKGRGQVIVGVSDQSKTDLLPGGNKAVLTLANGSKIVLDSAGNGTLARQGNMQVVKLDSGIIAYNGNQRTGTGETLYNTISTPRGGQYKLLLPDGSRVWLNSETILRYPTAFIGADRSVELLSGEAYLEVSHEPSQPFILRVPTARAGDQEVKVQVLGTSFDVNAYPDEPAMDATLLEGLVKVMKGKKTVLLHPGQQGQAHNGSKLITVNSAVNLQGLVAWKDGLFSFDRAGTKAVMRQLARWYDVDISYEGKIPTRQFVGTIPRNVPASVVLKALEYNDVHFRIVGKKIIVTP